MKRYYFDKDAGGIARKWTDWLGHGAALVTRSAKGLDVNGAQLQADDSFAIFYHMSYATAENIAGYALQYPKGVHVGVSGNGNSVTLKEENAYLVQCSVGKPDDPAFAARVSLFLNRLEQSGKPHFWDLEPDGEEALALRLLCEAYALPKNETGCRIYQPREKGAKSISVECPDPGIWFDLIGASKPANDKDEAAITAFGRLMGDATGAAMDLARAIVQPSGDISGLADEFVKRVSEISAAQAGGPK